MTNTTAKTPGVAIARVLRNIGLKQGHDFRVKGVYRNGDRIGTEVQVYDRATNQLIADNADLIEARVQLDGGWVFKVSVRYTSTGHVWVMVNNCSGESVRETAPKSPDLPRTAKLTLRSDDASPVPASGPKSQLVTAARQAQKLFGSLTWTCTEAGQEWFFQNTPDERRYTLRYYRGRADVEGWYLSDNAGGQSFAGRSLTVAALAVADIYFADRKAAQQDPHGAAIAAAAAAYPRGTRVTAYDASIGRGKDGTVNGVDIGVVTKRGHDNYGRVYIGVEWDAVPERQWRHRARPFVDTLTKI